MKNIVLQITKKCDQACPHCFFDSSPKASEELSLDQVKNGIIDLKKAGISNVSRFIITGGEPTLFSKLKELVEFIRREYPLASVRLDTNGVNFYRNQKLFKEIRADIYDISVDSFHNAGIIKKSKIYKNIFVNNKGRSRILDFFIKKKKEYKFNLNVRWTSNEAEEALFNLFFDRYNHEDIYITRKNITATGRGKLLIGKIGDGYLVEENEGNFKCLMGNSILLAIDGYWYGCYHPISLTKLCKSGSSDFSKNFKKLTESEIFKTLPRLGILRILRDCKRGASSDELNSIDDILKKRYWYRCEPCKDACACGIFKI